MGCNPMKRSATAGRCNRLDQDPHKNLHLFDVCPCGLLATWCIFSRARCWQAADLPSRHEKRYYWGSFQSFDLPLIPSGKRPQVVSVS
jgi:hypothetical protein